MSRLIVMPVIIQMFVLGYAITTEVKNTTLTIVDYSNTPLSASLTQAVIRNQLFHFVGYSASQQRARKALDAGIAKIALVIPADFARNAGRGAAARWGFLSTDRTPTPPPSRRAM